MSFFTSFCDLPQKEQQRLPFDSSRRRSTIYGTYVSPTSHEPVNRPISEVSLGRLEAPSKRGGVAKSRAASSASHPLVRSAGVSAATSKPAPAFSCCVS